MIHLTRKETFSAAHRMFRVDWSLKKNEKVFGKCANSNFHGHTYSIFVTVKGNPNPETGYILDLKKLSAIIKALVINKCDHKNLNKDVDFLKGILPSTENIAIAIWNQLKTHIESLNCQLYCIRVCESENNFSEYFGDQ